MIFSSLKKNCIQFIQRAQSDVTIAIKQTDQLSFSRWMAPKGNWHLFPRWYQITLIAVVSTDDSFSHSTSLDWFPVLSVFPLTAAINDI